MRAYRTVRTNARIELVIQKSRFIGWCFPVEQEQSAQCMLDDIRKQHWDASHNCYAYAIGAQGGTARYSDDGEPGGTAGLPMMEAIRQKGVTDILCIVTRYFGGVLLGAGGLVRAYSKAASTAIEAAGMVDMRPCTRFTVQMEYARYGALEPLLRRQGELTDVRFTECVQADILIPAERSEAFAQLVIEKTDGRVRPQAAGMCYGAFPTEAADIGRES